MSLFPSTLDLLLPNWNSTTVIGVIVIILALIGFYAFSKGNKLLEAVGIQTNLAKISAIMLGVGIILVWGVSIAQDFLNSKGGAVMFWGTIAVFVVGIILFWQPKKKGKTLKLF